MNLVCPHCHKTINAMEPKDLDQIGLGQNIRAPYVKDGSLPIWANLRSGKFFLFLREDVDNLLEQRRQEGLSRMVHRLGLPEQDEKKALLAMERAFKDAGITLPGEKDGAKIVRAATKR